MVLELSELEPTQRGGERSGESITHVICESWVRAQQRMESTKQVLEAPRVQEKREIRKVPPSTYGGGGGNKELKRAPFLGGGYVPV